MIDTTSTYHVAYAVVGVIYAAYAISLWVRARRLRERLAAARIRPEPRPE
ncbi:MAG TPA: hypothetical protein VL524_14905 [Gemmatimonadaceae bacterium]|jgi:hypothetical protein|nr:hypothetical protein [Gemmatimonadaceae bacterium]